MRPSPRGFAPLGADSNPWLCARGRYVLRMTPLVVGFGLGFLVAAQLGPISLLAIRSTLRNGLLVGLAIAAGVAVVDTLYAAAGAAGAAGLLAIEPLRLAFGLVGAAVLALLGARTLWSAFRIRAGGESREELATPRAAFVTALGATASNPLTIASWAAVFTAASTAGAAAGSAAALLLAGVGLGSLTCMAVLAGGVSVARRRVGPRMLRAVDGIAGAGILTSGGLLAFRTLRD
jgi:putative LysE/RhtB family amino acid efflux pump